VTKNVIFFDEELVLELLVFRTHPDIGKLPNQLFVQLLFIFFLFPQHKNLKSTFCGIPDVFDFALVRFPKLITKGLMF